MSFFNYNPAINTTILYFYFVNLAFLESYNMIIIENKREHYCFF